MADEEKKESVFSDAFFVIALLVILVWVWYMSGGPGRAELGGLFLAPPPPIGSGESYGPQIGEPSPYIEQPAPIQQ